MLRTIAIIACLLVASPVRMALPGCDDTNQPVATFEGNLEQLMCAVQERHYVFTGQFVTWPEENGLTPGPFPPPGFYESARYDSVITCVSNVVIPNRPHIVRKAPGRSLRQSWADVVFCANDPEPFSPDGLHLSVAASVPSGS